MSLHCHHRPSRGPPGAFAARCVVHRARRGECHGRKEARGKSRGRPSQPPPRPSSRGSCADARGPACTTGCPWAQPAAQWWSADCRCPRRRSIAPQPESVPHFPGQPCQRLRPQSVRSKLEKKTPLSSILPPVKVQRGVVQSLVKSHVLWEGRPVHCDLAKRAGGR